MKWSVVGLVLLGLFAAVCATLLVGSLRADAARRARALVPGGPEGSAVQEVNILIAANELQAMTVVEARFAVVKRVLKEEAPLEYFSDPVQVAGQVLALPMVEGQVFIPACFVTGGSGKQLAAALRDGMRAVSVSLSDASGMDGILYPGSIVDVLVSLRLPSPDGGKGDVLSTTLLERLQVLAIDDRMIVSSEEDKNTPRRNRAGRRMVTLMVDLRQAEMLRLAMEYGTVSLAMRSPLDTAPIPPDDGVLLRQLFPVYAERLTQLTNAESAGSASEATDEPPVASANVRPSTWDVLILRGESRETRSVPHPTARPAG